MAQNEPYSVIYFSDHGLAHYEDSNGLSLHPNNLYKQDYEIPFIMFSSDSQKVEKIKRHNRHLILFMVLLIGWELRKTFTRRGFLPS